jgi:serine/threonine protein kinase
MNYSINGNSVEVNGDVISIDNIVFTSLIGKGANSVVFKGYDELLDRYLAIKIWVTKKEDNRDKYKQALKESQQLAALKHDNIVNIYRANSHHGKTISLEMEFLNGTTLGDYLESAAPSIEFRCKTWKSLYGALSYSYSLGLFHGDLHEGNILVLENNNIKLIDYGTSLYAKVDSPTDARDAKLLLKLFKKIFGDKYYSLIDDKDILSEKPEIALNSTNTIVFLIERTPLLLHYIQRDAIHLAESEAGHISASIVDGPFVAIKQIVGYMHSNNICEHYINVFLNGCINKLRLFLSSNDTRGMKGFHYDQTPIASLVKTVEELLNEAKVLHQLMHDEDRANYLSKIR